MAECAESCEVMFGNLLTKMVSYKTISCTLAGDAKGQYRKFLKVVKENKSEFSEFNKRDKRLDTFLWNFLLGTTKYESMCEVFKIILILCHGQAQVEKGCSENNKLLVENHHTESLIAQ